MASIDQENLQRTQAERRILAENSSSNSNSTAWIIGILAIVAVILAIFMFSGDDDAAVNTTAPAVESNAPALTQDAAPAVAEETAPVTTQDEAPAATTVTE